MILQWPRSSRAKRRLAPGCTAGIAEQEVYALAGKHALALLYYRHAIHMTVQAGDPEIFSPLPDDRRVAGTDGGLCR